MKGEKHPKGANVIIQYSFTENQVRFFFPRHVKTLAFIFFVPSS